MSHFFGDDFWNLRLKYIPIQIEFQVLLDSCPYRWLFIVVSDSTTSNEIMLWNPMLIC